MSAKEQQHGLQAWATDVAKKLGATRLTIEADPNAAPFYRGMGAYDVGQAPSGSVPKDVAETSDEPLRCGLTFRSETGLSGHAERERMSAIEARRIIENLLLPDQCRQ
jgi:hypothetical protein